ncbi:MAG: hypothetical protein WC600_13210 [Desulfobaccales bacterium]
MPISGRINAAESGAFVQLLKIEPTGSGPLDGLNFGVRTFLISVVTLPAAVIRTGPKPTPPPR